MKELSDLLYQYIDDCNNDEINFKLGLWYHDHGHTAAAVSYYLRTAERTQDDLLKYEALVRASMCFTSQGIRKFTVKGLLQQAITIMPYRPEAYYELSQVFEYQEYGDGRWFDAYTHVCIALDMVDFDNLEPLRRPTGYLGEFQLLFQKAHLGWHCGLCDDARNIFTDLLDNWDIPKEYKTLCSNNLNNIGGKVAELHPVYHNKKVRRNLNRLPDHVPAKLERVTNVISPNSKVNTDFHKFKRGFIVDNFYKDPDAIRKMALQVEYDQGGIGRGYIGNRSKDQFFFDGIKQAFEEIIGKKITTWENHYSSGRFQYNPAGEPLVYHCDENRWAAMIFLTPDAPAQCGTALYRHKKSGVHHNSDPRLNEAFNQKTFLDGTPYEEVDRFGNIYNRLVIFDGGCIHAASEYFGSELNDCRLWHMFFFDTED